MPAIAKSAPRVAALIPSRMKGNWIENLDAPTSLIMPISRLLENALSLMVVEISYLDKGQVVGEGTFAELKTKVPDFAKAVELMDLSDR